MQFINMQAIKRFLLINFGLVITGLGMHFLVIPNNLAAGGISGLGMVIKTFIPDINLGLIMMAFNVVLFILAFILIGKDFGGYTIYASFALSALIAVFEEFIPIHEPIVDDLMITLLLGIFIQAIGLAIVFYQNASTGGTDIIAKIINKYTHMEIGKALFISDATVATMAFFVFSPLLGMYAMFGIILNALVIDQVIAGFGVKVQLHIISKTPEKIVEFITKDLDRGATYIHTTGGYSGDPHKMISVVLSRSEYLKLRNHLKATDPRAFIIMNYVHEVLGEGFGAL